MESSRVCRRLQAHSGRFQEAWGSKLGKALGLGLTSRSCSSDVGWLLCFLHSQYRPQATLLHSPGFAVPLLILRTHLNSSYLRPLASSLSLLPQWGLSELPCLPAVARGLWPVARAGCPSLTSASSGCCTTLLRMCTCGVQYPSLGVWTKHSPSLRLLITGYALPITLQTG